MKLTLAQQDYKIRALYPSFQSSYSKNKITWMGTLKPTDISDSYTIKINYKIGDCPKVFIISPTLFKLSDGTPIPHTYGKNRPCLYFPKSDQWHSGKFIATTIIPWTSLWLFYYETWHLTGEWLGGGVHPGENITSEAV